MKLELKHLAPYLPYKLRVHKLVEVIASENNKLNKPGQLLYKESRKGQLLSVSLFQDRVKTTVGSFDNLNYQWIQKERFVLKHICIRPILKPLSDLTKEIDINGEKFIPAEEIYNNCECDAEREYYELLEEGLTGIEEKSLYAPYTIIEQLLEWHFDIFGLIENGLAININEL